MGKKSTSTREKILATATELFLKKGVDRVGVREIAAKADINLSLMNYYFKSKEKLLELIFENLISEKATVLKNILESDISLFDKIKQYTSAYIDMLLDNPLLVSFVLSVLHRNPDKLKGMTSVVNLYNTEKFCMHLKAEAEAGNVREVTPEQFYVSMLSLIIFPFAIKDLIVDRNKFKKKEYVEFIRNRKDFIADMLIQYLKV
ncbi:MAG TPA: TetR/AcrR family transcriptional regulator [Tenuifilaceae bacterium]|nr:TetR/AcrR family transcriptional regulator [Tenuifilaceae bacterium]HPE18794.1 TetR/AcrR family transcriptional regulator [Tenuifilaceae bacterium]HPJ45993.1 TetR/AcrR family transcriptional regulator [Tenuifilaceae bacterium]HPQ34373.1 TetR/AcrR family transcriptional regulator [Tenuifilaceae bacterium]HRX68533.1 TetR/AcrR family transcriptional regulator [Tenuifilaceae bacterium]